MGGRKVFEGGEGGGSGTQKFVYQKWPNKFFPLVNFAFSHAGHFGLEGGGGVQGVPPPRHTVYGHWNTSLGGGGGGAIKAEAGAAQHVLFPLWPTNSWRQCCFHRNCARK